MVAPPWLQTLGMSRPGRQERVGNGPTAPKVVVQVVPSELQLFVASIGRVAVSSRNPEITKPRACQCRRYPTVSLPAGRDQQVPRNHIENTLCDGLPIPRLEHNLQLHALTFRSPQSGLFNTIRQSSRRRPIPTLGDETAGCINDCHSVSGLSDERSQP